MSNASTEGGCQCGAIRYRITGTPVMSALCHCTLCRRANAAPVVAWAMYAKSQVVFVADPPAVYESSPGCRRGFCARCGTQVSFAADYMPGLVDITVGSLDHPERMPPALHYWDSERLPWVAFADALPRHDGFPPSG